MKTKTKMIALVEIAIVLCSLFLVATLPAIAAEQNQTTQKVSASANTVTTASEDDYVLGVYGNANEDDTIDMGDVVYTKLAIFGKKPKTELCDAKYDGRINVLDVIQTKLIILGKEKEITYEDDYEEVETIRKPVKRIVTGWLDSTEILKALDAGDKIAGIDKYTAKNTILYPEISKLPLVGYPFVRGLDAEAVLNVNPDAYYPWVFGIKYPGKSGKRQFEKKLPGVTLICLDVGMPETFAGNVRKLGYILDRRDEAEELINFHEETLNTIKDKTAGLSEDEKRRVYIENYRRGTKYQGYKTGLSDIAGGKNILGDLPAFAQITPEWIMDQDPEVIIIRKGAYGDYSGFMSDDPSELRAVCEEMLNRLELAEVAAVKNKDVYVIDGGHLTRGPGNFIGAVYFAKWFYPELMEDLDPQAIHQEYIDRFQRIDYDLDEHGVFVYPKEPVS